jgi:hypothetical protein
MRQWETAGTSSRAYGGVPRQRFTLLMRDALGLVPKSAQHMVAATIRTVFAQPKPAAAREQWRRVADTFQLRFGRVAELMDEAEADVLAYLAFPSVHWRQIWSTDEFVNVATGSGGVATSVRECTARSGGDSGGDRRTFRLLVKRRWSVSATAHLAGRVGVFRHSPSSLARPRAGLGEAGHRLAVRVGGTSTPPGLGVPGGNPARGLSGTNTSTANFA